jgi:predicted DNA-binding protein (MmcQ/YjbR family)
MAWGHPVFRAGKAMFCGYEEVRGKWCVNVKLEEPHADLLRDDPRVVASQYLGGERWIWLEAASIEDWGEIADLIV